LLSIGYGECEWMMVVLFFIFVLMMNGLLAALPFFYRPLTRDSVLFSVSSFSLTLWGVGNYMLTFGENPLFWNRFSYSFSYLYIVAAFLFLLSFSWKKFSFKHPFSIVVLVSSFIMFVSCYTPFVLIEQTPQGSFVFGEGNKVWMILFLTYLMLIIAISLRGIFKKTGSEKYRVILYFSGLLIFVFLALMTNLFLPMIGITDFYFMGPLFSTVFIVFSFISILKYDLMKLRVIISRAVSNVLSLFPILMSYLILGGVFHGIDVYFLILAILISFFWSFNFEKMRTFLQTYTDKKFVRGFYSLEEVMRSISLSLSQVQDRWSALASVSTILKDDLEICNVLPIYPMFRSGELTGYIFFSSEESSGTTLSLGHPFIKFCSRLEVVEPISNMSSITEIHDSLYEKFLKGYVLSVYASGQMQGIILIGQKINEGEFDRKDLKLFNSVASQLGIVFDKIAHQRKFKESTKRVAKESKLSQHFLQEAQLLSQKATLANLTKGIAHEIKNPVNNMKIHVQTFKDDIRKQLYFKTSKESNETWMGRLDIKTLRGFCDSESQALSLVKELTSLGYLDENGYVTSLYSPERLDFNLKLSSDFDPILGHISDVLTHTKLKRTCWDMFSLLEEEYNRISRLTTSMLKYGEAGKGITMEAFSEIMSFENSSMVWRELVEKRLINHAGFVEPKFYSLSSRSSLGLSNKFRNYESAIYLILKNNPYAQKVELDVNRILQQVLDSCRGRFKKEFIQLEERYESELNIVGSEDAIKQCFLNILDNSVDALISTSKSNRILNVSTMTQEHNVIVEIEDSGIGVEKKDLEKICDPFFTTKSRTEGRNSGLGLSFVYQTLEGHDGRVIFDSKINVGTRVRLVFPGMGVCKE